jgi:sugar O-acyltransferase (sialic acid O-acetyltransferase NeuD family)
VIEVQHAAGAPRPIAFFGAGGHGRELLQVVLDINAASDEGPIWQPMGFIVDREAAPAVAAVHDLPLLSGIEWLTRHPEVCYVVAVGPSASRRRVVQRIGAACGNPPATLIHPRAWMGRGVELGRGCVVCAGSLLTTDIRLGAHVHVNVGSTIAHDTVLDDYVTLGPGVHLAGGVVLREGVELGVASAVMPRAEIGRWSVIGAGAVVIRSLPANVTAVGTPAKPIKARKAGWHEDANA